MWEKIKTWYRLYFTDRAYESENDSISSLCGVGEAPKSDNTLSIEKEQAKTQQSKKRHKYTLVEIELLKSSMSVKEVVLATGLTASQVYNYRDYLKRKKLNKIVEE